MLDGRVLETLARLEAEDAAERHAGLPSAQRSRAVAPTTGRFLFGLAAAQAGIEVLEIGASRGYSSIWLAAGARMLGGRLVSLEQDPAKCAAWRENIASAGLDEWAELVEGDAHETLARTGTSSISCSWDARRTPTRCCSDGGPLLEPGGLVVADNVLSHVESLGAYSAAAQATRHCSSVTVPLDRASSSVVARSCLTSLPSWCGRVAPIRRVDDPPDADEHRRAPSIRSKCVCWQYRGKEVVRLER
jgi:predicted O-methyltransferase YrrM